MTTLAKLDMPLKENILHSSFCHPGFRRVFEEEVACQVFFFVSLAISELKKLKPSTP